MVLLPSATTEISIHALLTESDLFRCLRFPRICYFNPRSPHGERPAAEAEQAKTYIDFNPRSPHGERQRSDFLTMTKVQISIHALLTESDLTDEFSSPDGRRFQSTLSSRRATMNIALRTSLPSNFNPRSPHGERRAIWCPTGTPRNFNPRSPHGERRAGCILWDGGRKISIHALLTESDSKYHQIGPIVSV